MENAGVGDRSDLVTAFVGGLPLSTDKYISSDRTMLVAAATLTAFKRTAQQYRSRAGRTSSGRRHRRRGRVGAGPYRVERRRVPHPVAVAASRASPRRAAQLAPPFILCNSVVGLAMRFACPVRVVAARLPVCLSGALAGAAAGTAIGLRWMSERATRYVLAVDLLSCRCRLPYFVDRCSTGSDAAHLPTP